MTKKRLKEFVIPKIKIIFSGKERKNEIKEFNFNRKIKKQSRTPITPRKNVYKNNNLNN